MTITLHLPTGQATPDPWWTCPAWCTTCYGGHSATGRAGTFYASRVHEGALATVPVPDEGLRGYLTLTVAAQRFDGIDGPGEVRTILRIEPTVPQHLNAEQVNTQLAGISGAERNNLLAHYLSGAADTVAVEVNADAARTIAAALATQTT